MLDLRAAELALSVCGARRGQMVCLEAGCRRSPSTAERPKYAAHTEPLAIWFSILRRTPASKSYVDATEGGNERDLLIRTHPVSPLCTLPTLAQGCRGTRRASAPNPMVRPPNPERVGNSSASSLKERVTPNGK